MTVERMRRETAGTMRARTLAGRRRHGGWPLTPAQVRALLGRGVRQVTR